MKLTKPKAPPSKITFKTRAEAEPVFPKWWEAKDKEKAAGEMLSAVVYLKQNQQERDRKAYQFARLYGNHSLYSFIGSNASMMSSAQGSSADRPTFNLIQSVVDTLTSRIGQSRPQPVFLTDNSDYKQRMLAKKLNGFIQGEFYRTKTYDKAVDVLRDSLIEGTGIIHVYETQDKKVGLERVLLTELEIDQAEGMYGEPRRLYRTKLIDRDVLLADFPDLAKKIDIATNALPDNSAEVSRSVSDLVIVAEGWSLPSFPGAKDGRHVIACSAGSLLDEPYEKDDFPFVFMHYCKRMLGFWSQGIAEQLVGTQMELNSILYTISRAIKLVGVPRVFQEDSSKVVSAHHNNEIGVIVKFRGTKPSYEVAPCNAPELYAERDKLIQYGYQQSGVSSLQASSQKPQGLDSGEAIRTYDDIATDRFASLSRRYDNMFIDLAYKIIDLAKDIAKRDGKYSTVYPNKRGTQEIDLPKAGVLEDTFIIQCFTQSSLPKDPAGRLQKITELTQAGMITIQEGRRLLDYPDLDQIESLANAAEERIYKHLDEIVENGKYTPPDTFTNLALAEQIVVQYINLFGQCKLEESKMDMLKDYFSQIQAWKQAAIPSPQPDLNAPQAPPQGANPQAVPQAPPTSPLLPNAPGAA